LATGDSRLVVIAIIAILAAILFPVFAQAKIAAKKTVDVSNLKQSSTGVAIYTNDNDDTYPLAYRFTPDPTGGTWRFNFSVSTPIGWMGPGFAQGQPARMAEDSVHWSNTIQPYLKNYGLYEGPGLAQFDIYGAGNPANKIASPANVNMSFNGIIHAWSATNVVNASKLIVFWEGRGASNAIGNSLTNPALYCDQPIETAAGPCIFTPGGKTQGGSATSGGAWFGLLGPAWCYGHFMNFTFGDTSAKTRTVGAQTNATAALQTANANATNAQVDPFTGYDTNGNPIYMWFSSIEPYPYLFRPDYAPSN